MSGIDLFDHPGSLSEEELAERRKKLAEAILSGDSPQAESKISNQCICRDEKEKVKNTENDIEQGCTRKVDEYGNEVLFDSDGNILCITVSNVKYD